MLDMKTVIFSYAITNVLCVVVITLLWSQNRKRFRGLGFWLADFILQFIALPLVALRGVLPDFISMVVSNTLIVGGTILLLVGLEQFTGKPSKQKHNILFLAVFISIHAYFLYAQPSLQARTVNVSFGIVFVCAQCAWLIFRKADADMRPILQNSGVIFGAYCMVNVARIIVDLVVQPGDDFFKSGALDTLIVLINQVLFIALTFSLSLTVNRRLVADLERDIIKRKQVEEALRLSEEKFFKAFHASPDVIIITRISDGKIVEVNDGFWRIIGYTRAEALSSSTISLGIWANPQDRDACIAALRENNHIHNYEYDFRAKSGEIIHCLYSGEIIQLENEAHILSVVRDITESKRMEAELRESEIVFSSFLENSPAYIFFKDKDVRAVRLSKNYEQMLGMPISAVLGKTMDELFPSDLAKSMVADDLRILNEGRRIMVVEELNGRIYETTKFPIYKDGKPDMLAGFTLDITERKQAENLVQLRLQLTQFADTHTLDELLQKTLDEVERLTDSLIGFYHFVEADQKTLSLQAWSTRTLQEFCKAEGKGMHYEMEKAGVWADCVRERRTVIHDDYASLPNRKGLPPGHAQVIRELVAPIIKADRIVAILGVGNKPQKYTERDIEVVTYVADIVWEIIARKQYEVNLKYTNEQLQIQLDENKELQSTLRELSIRDPLTGAFNRRYMEEAIKQECARAEREGYPISIVLLDLDHLKEINGKYGHVTGGDQALRLLGEHLNTMCRAGDIVCRYGGDEFLVILHDAHAQAAYQRAEQWRKSLAEIDIRHNDMKFNVAFSAGIAAFPAHGKSIEDILLAADYALYRAKEAGRNCIKMYEPK